MIEKLKQTMSILPVIKKINEIIDYLNEQESKKKPKTKKEN
jgi:hypothetical protein